MKRRVFVNVFAPDQTRNPTAPRNAITPIIGIESMIERDNSFQYGKTALSPENKRDVYS